MFPKIWKHDGETKNRWFVSSLWSCFSITTVAERLEAEPLVPAETKLGRLDGGEGGVVDSGSGEEVDTAKYSEQNCLPLVSWFTQQTPSVVFGVYWNVSNASSSRVK